MRNSPLTIAPMRLAIIIPDRRDRPKFLENCLRMIAAQRGIPKVHIELVDDAPLNDRCDITWRYRTGYERVRGKGYDLIAFMENDDWYAEHYLSTMIANWEMDGRPKIYGTDQTIYYHLKLHKYYIMRHVSRASMMNTFMVPDLPLEWPHPTREGVTCKLWPVDTDPYTDIHVWKNVPGKVIRLHDIFSIGMKHGVGKCGGRSHVDRLERYIMPDGLELLERNLDGDSLKFYKNVFTEV